MKILIASCVFPPEPVVSAKTSFDVANLFASIDNEVNVICPKPSRNCSSFERPQVDKFKVSQLFSISSKKSTFSSRFMENISFGVSAFVYILFGRKHDVIYSNVWPIFATALVVLAGKFRGSRVILSAQDLYPESLFFQSRIDKTHFFYKLLFRIDAWIAKSADHIVVISDRFRDAYSIDRQIPLDKITVIPNWVDGSKMLRIPSVEARRRANELTDGFFDEANFYIVYGGNVGVASGLQILPELICAASPDCRFLVAGDGALLPSLKKKIAELGLQKRVFFLSPWPESSTSIIFSAADLLFLPTAQGQSLASVPSKLITYMLSERPILAVVDTASDTATEIKKARCGFICSSYDVQAVIQRIAEIRDLKKEDLYEIGRNGRKYAEKFYSLRSASEKLVHVVDHLYDN